MTEKKRTTAKSFRSVLLTILILMIIAATIGCRQSSNLEQQSQKALNQLLSCTLQQAEDFDKAVAADQASIEAAADGEIGLAQGSDELQDYFKKRFGDSMTDECIEDLAKSRTFYRSIALAKEFGSNIEAGEIELTKRSDDQECYTFSANIKTSAGDSAAAAEGTISMEKDGTEWKASQITLTMKYEEEFTVDCSELPEEERNGFTKITIPYMVNLDYYVDPQAKEVVRIGMDYSEGIKAGEIANLMFSGMTREEAEKEVSENEPMGSHRIIMDIKNFNGDIQIDAPEDL